MGDDRGTIMEKRSSMRGWHERGGKKPRKNKKLGIALIAVIFLAVMASAFMGNGGQDSGPTEPSQKKTPVPTTAPTPAPETTPRTTTTPTPPQTPPTTTAASDTIPPSITLNSLQNVTIDDNTPILNITTIENQLDTVWVSVSGGQNVSYTHNNNTVAFGHLNLLFADDFSGKVSLWTPISGTWTVEDEEYIGKGGLSETTEIEPSVQAIYEFKAIFISNLGLALPALGLRLWTDDNNNMLFKIYPQDSSYAPSGGYIGQREKGTWTYHQTSAPITIDYNQWYTITIYFDRDHLKVNINGLPWLDYTLQNPNKVYKNLRLDAYSNAHFDDIVVYQPLSDGQHYVTVYANDTAGNLGSIIRDFIVTTTPLTTTAEPMDDKSAGIGDTVVKGGYAVTLDHFDGRFVVKKGSGSSERIDFYSRVDITVKNIGDTEEPVKFAPKPPALIDNLENQYEFVKINHDDEIKQTVLYPPTHRKGALFFEPMVTIKANSVRLVMYINDEKYEFIFDRY